MVKILKSVSFKEFFNTNEHVAHSSPMRTHYHSPNPLERLLWKQKKKEIQNILAEIKPKNIIDLGCGDGGMLEIIPQQTNYTGIDISPTQIAYAKKAILVSRKKNAQVILGDITKLKIKNNTFEAVLACDVLEHVLSLESLFTEMKRIVKKNGYIILSVPNEFLWEACRALLLRFPLRSPDHLSAIEPKDIEKHFSNIVKKEFLPVSFSSKLSLIHIYLIKNNK